MTQLLIYTIIIIDAEVIKLLQKMFLFCKKHNLPKKTGLGGPAFGDFLNIFWNWGINMIFERNLGGFSLLALYRYAISTALNIYFVFLSVGSLFLRA